MTSSTADKYTTTEYGKQNMFGAEVAPWVDENDNYEGYAVNAEKTNGRWAMIGFIALIGACNHWSNHSRCFLNELLEKGRTN